MYADTIVAAPNTITGSIGVIGGWMYNKDLKEKLGMSTDLVKRGAHADLGFGFTLPFLGLGIPDRNLTTEERAKAELVIRSFYKEFVTKVATGRRTTFEKIEPIAQGRVWSGTDGKANGLVDEMGGLETALSIARAKASIKPGEEVTIVELPRPGLIDMSRLVSKLLGFEESVKEDPVIQQLKFRLKHNGEPLPIMSIDDFDVVAP
jgi:protease-4